ncbi:MAG: Asp-tRNA(Asn)/Glu-tRNA(Gln) amidotransferase subunit GatA [Deltaproteobacteria bacterium]|nr:Asp-tRNA(Asn)/Glu-tRNA(Gln) amidotransferase subunit GatA [Deltaproteobacteria bacterium]
MSTTELGYLTIGEAAIGLRQKKFSASELTRGCLARIDAFDGKLHAFITLTRELALKQAEQADTELQAGKDRGPLHGIPIALKDLYATRGIRTTCHSAVLEHWIPDFDATAATKLSEAGTILLGKVGMHEFAFGGPSVDAPFPAVRNPWNPAHIPGGSSSGSGAALAAGLCHGALGSDTGGSIRTPAAHCGIVGIKPTFGRVSRYGVIPLSWSLDHAGPMARSVEDCAMLLQVLAGYDPKDPASADVPVPNFQEEMKGGVKGLRVGVPRKNWFDENLGIHQESEEVFNEALRVLESLGAQIIDIDGKAFSLARKANQTILISEAYTYHEKTCQETPEKLGSSVRRRIIEGAFMSAADYITAQRARAVLNEQIRADFSRVDVFAVPGAARPPEPFEGMDPNELNLRPSFTNPFNLTGLPAISVPCGFTQGNLPAGLQIVAPPFAEAACFRAAYSYEQATDWRTRRPSL